MTMISAHPNPLALLGAAVVVRAQQGDTAAQEELARLCQRQAYLLALQLTGHREDALELAQDAVLRVFGALARFEASRPLRPWLLQIVRNLVRDRARRRQLRRTEPLEAGEGGRGGIVLEPADAGPDPEALATRHQQQELVWRAVQQLSPEHREVVALRDYLDLPYDEIAAVLKLPRGTVMSRLHRARRHLQQTVRELVQRQQPVGHGGAHDQGMACHGRAGGRSRGEV